MNACFSYFYEHTNQRGGFIYFARAGHGTSRDPNLGIGTNGLGPYSSVGFNWNDKFSSNYYKGKC